MNTKEIEQSLKEHALKLEHGDDTEQQLGQKLVSVMAELEAYRKSKERPIDAETLKQIHVGTPKFQPRHLRPEDMRMKGKKPY